MFRVGLLLVLAFFQNTAVLATSNSSVGMESVYIDKQYTTIGQFASFLKEENQNLSLKEVRVAFREGAFHQLDQNIPAFGLSSAAVWLRLNVINDTGTTQVRRFIVNIPWLDFIDVYIINNKEQVKKYLGGDARVLQRRHIYSRNFTIEHTFQEGNSEIYLRITTNEPIVLPIYLDKVDIALQKDKLISYHYGILYGVIGGLLLFNLLIYFSIRQKRYLYYVFYLMMYLLMDFSYTGHGFLYIWKDAIFFQKWMTTISITLYSTAGILFALSFLRIKKLFIKTYNNTLWFISAFLLVQLILFISDNHLLSVFLSLFYVSFFSLFTLYLAVTCFNKGYKDAIYYLAATFATLIGAATTVFSVMGFVPYNYLTFHAGEIAVALDAILLSMALAEQIRRAQIEMLLAQKLARKDSLTHLSNRLAFDEVSEKVWQSTLKHNHKLCFIMLDLDFFKNVNDKYGHAAGDEVLKQVSGKISEVVRDDDMLVRWGGEEFAIILPKSSLYYAKLLAERIRKHIENLKVEIDHNTIMVTVSLGVAQRTENTQSMNELLSKADKNLYEAKQAGRNQVCALL